ncbi:MAG TPA: phosphoglycerate mutase family protein [Solirubrobacteraceae bacterium]|nr:phosphoglycerate mutase family protein [Solirubrobacteraceae bacterium]
MIWLLRHADAAPGEPDEARPLTAKGERQARAAGLALARLGVRLDACLTSPRVRALETARLACEPIGLSPAVTRELDGGPFDAQRLAAGLGDVLLVGHNPSMQQALRDLTGARTRLRKGALAAVAERELELLLGPAELAAVAGEVHR